MPSISRFERASSSLTLSGLLKKTRRVFWICAAVGIAAHLSSTQFRGSQAEVRAAKPLTTQFVKRQPRLTKPLELKKRPQPKRRAVQREMVAVTASRHAGDQRVAFQPAGAIGGLARPSVQVGRIPRFETAAVEPLSVAQAVESAREDKERVDMSLELLDIEALDTGQYHAMIIVDPANKRSIKGFFHLCVAYSTCIPQKDPRSGSWFPDMVALPNLVEKINEWTDIKADIAGSLPLDSREIFKIPFVFISTHIPFTISESEAANFGRYLCLGGFALVEDCTSILGGYADRALRQMLKDALLTQGFRYGRDWNFDMLPNDHAIFHTYFDLDGPPLGWGGICYHRNPTANPIRECLEGIHVEGRLAAVYSLLDYGDSWDDFRLTQGLDSTREFQFGVNLVIFALTQEGSITRRLMESVAY